jgi:methionyl-tRNA formyltransferase
MKIIFMGTSGFGLPTLKKMVADDCNIVAVYTQPPRPAGRGKKLKISPIGQFAVEKKLRVYYPENFSRNGDINKFKSLEK